MPAEPVNVVGYHGKVPTHGDFVSRGLPNTFIGPWDVWLQEAIHTSRQQLGNNWLDYYLTSPLYRFVLSPGICGDSAWMGMLMPSVDKVGRYYPITISLKDHEASNPFAALQKHNGWFEQVELLALSCLKDDFNLDNFYQGICQLTPNFATQPPDKVKPLTSQDGMAFPAAFWQPLKTLEAMPDILPSILDKLLKDHCFAYSLWWTQGSEHVSPSLLICAGLPPFDGIAAMFDGNWQQWDWEGQRYPVQP
ncbi:type VI secretion system-associated protein TagF [Methyloglobulus sp.]|uniref:type VI secretion system-associated protein TagF n=1 Tax=Methyloglobulus sp. TaxID=2518622 RepID=UPI003988AE52